MAPTGEPKRTQTCVDCGIESPSTDTNYTLISARHGWRLTLGTDAGGQRSMQWRCPQCWQRHRDAQTPR